MQRKCDACGREFDARRRDARFCSPTCRVRAHRAPERRLAPVVELPAGGTGKRARPRKAADVDEPVVEDADGPLTAATRRAVRAAGRLEDPLGLAVLALAVRIDTMGPAEGGSAFAALIREHRAALTEALRDAEQADDPLEQIRTAAALKLVSGS